MKQILTTKRLILRELTPGDYDALCVMLRDKDVMYAYEHAFSAEEARGWLNRQLDRYKTDGFGLWAVILLENGRLIGQCGITKQDVGGKTVREVGYIFDKNFRHKGYAAEAAAACKNYAFDVLGESEVYSIIRVGNEASVKVALANGMKPVGQIIKHYYGMDMPHIVYMAAKV